MDITFLGTGSAFNHKDGNNSALLRFENKTMLLDCGYDTPQRLEQVIKLADLDYIWISHVHADHIGGLEEIAFKSKFMLNGKKITLIAHEDIYDDLITLLTVPLKYSDDDDEFLTVDDYFNIKKVGDIFTIGENIFNMIPTKHIRNMPAFMLRIKNVIFTGDTKFIDWSMYDLSDIDYIFQDTQLETYPKNVHTTLSEIITLPTDVKQKIFCMHYGSNVKDYENVLIENELGLVEPFEKIYIV